MYTTEDDERVDRAASLRERPEFNLVCLYDDPQDPENIAVVPPEDDVSRQWIVTEFEHAVSVETLV